MGAGISYRRAALTYLLLATALLPGVLLGGRAFLFRDVSLFWLPNVEGFVRAVIGGEAPLWDPHIGFGKPILADPGEQAAYPLTWLNLLVLPTTYYALFLVTHVVWAGLGTFGLARERGLSPWASLAAGAVWCCSGPFVSAFSLWHHFAGSAWLPWVLLALERLLARPSAGRGVLLGVAAGAQALAGSADLCLMAALLGALRALPALRTSPRLALVRGLALSLAVAAGLAAVQWLPTLETIPGSLRSGYPPERLSMWSLHPLRATEAFFAVPFDILPIGNELRARLFDGREAFLGSVYLGLAALGLVALGLVSPASAGLRRFRRELSLGLALLTLLALGRHAPLYDWLRRLPGFDLIRFPVKFALPASLLFAWLAGVGWTAWEAGWEPAQARRARRLAAGGLTLAAALGAAAGLQRLRPSLVGSWLGSPDPVAAAATLLPALLSAALALATWATLLHLRARGATPTRGLSLAALAVVVLDLGLATKRLNPTAPAELLREWRPSLVVPLALEPPPVRLHVLTPGNEWVLQHSNRVPEGLTGPAAGALGQFELLTPPIGARWGLDGSFAPEFTGQERAETEPLRMIVNFNLGSEKARRLLMAGGVSHVVSVEPMPYPGLERVLSFETIYDQPIRLFRLAERLPRAYAVSGRTVARPPEAYELLGDAGFDVRRSVILPEGAEREPRDGFSSEVRMLWRRTASVGLEAELSHDGVVVLLDGWYPGWSVSVDGQPADLLRANVLFRGVAVAAGSHRIVFRYAPRAVSWGAWTTAATLAMLGVGGLTRLRGRDA